MAASSMQFRSRRTRSLRGAVLTVSAALLLANTAGVAKVPGLSSAKQLCSDIKASMNDWKLQGQLGGDGWKGFATYHFEDSAKKLQLQMEGEDTTPTKVGVSGAYEPKGGYVVEVGTSATPNMDDLSVSDVKYVARVKKAVNLGSLKFLPDVTPSIGATVTHEDATVDLDLTKPVTDDVDLTLKTVVKRGHKSQELKTKAGAEAAIKVKGGTLVAGVDGEVGGPKKVSAVYKMN